MVQYNQQHTGRDSSPLDRDLGSGNHTADCTIACLFNTNNITLPVEQHFIHRVSKKCANILLSLTLPNADQLSKILSLLDLGQKISSKTII